MPNSTVPAADAGLPNLNRRSALAKLGMGIAGGASLATIAAAAPVEAAVSSELLRLIEAHRSAHDALTRAVTRCDEAEVSYNGIRPSIPFKDMWAGKEYGADYKPLDISLGVDECKSRVIRSLDWSDRIGGGIDEFASPKRLKQLQAARKAIKNDAFAVIDAAFAEDEAARQSSGFAAAKRDVDQASDAEDEALTALCAYRCATLKEVQIKADYLSADHIEVEWFEERHFKALLQASRKMEA
ncbi:conserved hypothetical protein [Methylocella tundrae]|uniref:Uncharacterized protein n=1 Tax=Methylocella tundrae TaxID=227605 RepID=A0A8B6MCU6_METTU|nr:hypothetical protein [Methylocella tundrae]VTZ27241.1 conserved hypothetical protein [Methylocella tundrae]VTZ52179.1 conserved hypothetical protein [Methylocella tundrae]